MRPHFLTVQSAMSSSMHYCIDEVRVLMITQKLISWQPCLSTWASGDIFRFKSQYLHKCFAWNLFAQLHVDGFLCIKHCTILFRR
jgi:hypothetical protein